jgi:NAD(P)-dependent dehydrogenase (short-subunit alcohol dehydrogenase family)
MKMYDFTGKAALVTGAAQGIGREVALRLAAEGADLSLVDIQEEGLAETARLIADTGRTAVALQTDVTEAAAVHRAVERTLERFARIDFLVNVAGVGVCNPFLEVPEEDWDRTLNVNLKGTFLMCQSVGRHMVGRRQGRIVNMASISGKSGSEVLAPYSASKGGVILLTQSVARALAPFHINVNAICPGLVWTPMWRATATWFGTHDPRFQGHNLSPEQVYAAVVQAMTPLGEATTTRDIAAAVAFLLSEEARVITGQAINVDGGIEFH